MFLAQDVGGTAGRAPHDDFWYMPVGAISAAGVRVSPRSALAISAFFACAKVLGETFGVAPVHLYRRLDNGGKERATDHPLYRVIHHRPNRWQTAFQFRQMMQWHLAFRYNAYARKLFDRRGNITELIPLHPDHMRVERFAGADGVINFRYRYTDPATHQETVYVRDEIFHLRGLSSDGIEGLSLLDMQADSIGEAIASQKYNATRMRNDARPPLAIEWDGHFKSDDDAKEFRRSFQEAQTGSNAGKTVVLQRGMTLKELGIKNTDLQYIELRKLKNYDIAAMHRMPPHKIGILDRATNNNIEHQGLEFVVDTMMPWFVNHEQEISAQLLLDDEQDELFAETLVEGLMRGDSKARSEYYSKGILDGWLVRNEVRIRENLNPLPGLDKPLEPMNMRGAGDAPQPERVQTPAPEDDEDSAAARRLQALNNAAIERVVRKEVEMVRRAHTAGAIEQLPAAYTKHAAFVAAVMAVSEAEAQQYCEAQLALASDGSLEVAHFEEAIHARLQRLSGAAASKPEPIEQLAASLGAMAKAVATRPADQVSVHAPVQVTVPQQPAPSVTNQINVPERETHVHITKRTPANPWKPSSVIPITKLPASPGSLNNAPRRPQQWRRRRP